MLKIGLTGGIGSGKSTVADFFADLGVPIIDTDILARQAVAPGTAILQHIVDRFGHELVDTQGQLRRQQLRQIIFSSSTDKKWLENQLHPEIRHQLQQQLANLTAIYCIIAIPLLIESRYNFNVDRVLVVDVSPTTQLQRVMARDGLSRSEAKRIIAAQASRQQRLAKADDVIDNEHIDRQKTLQQVKQLHQQYLALAKG